MPSPIPVTRLLPRDIYPSLDFAICSSPLAKPSCGSTVQNPGQRFHGRTGTRLWSSVVHWEELRSTESVGSGGFGSVYKAEYFGETVALKTVKRRSKNTLASRQSFWAELNAAHLRHEHVVRILAATTCIPGEFGDGGSIGVILMEFVGSGNLQQLIYESAEPLQAQRWLRYSADIARGLRFLHSHDVVHLDIKPANVLISGQDLCKIADFGCSLKLDGGREAGAGSARASHVGGTYTHRSPELLKGEAVSPKADIFSFGITMWQQGPPSERLRATAECVYRSNSFYTVYLFILICYTIKHCGVVSGATLNRFFLKNCFLPRGVMLLQIFLLTSFCCVGCSLDVSVDYRDSYKIWLSSRAKTLEVRYPKGSDPVVLWNSSNPLLPESSSRRWVGYFYMMNNLTQADIGQYVTRDKNGLELEVYNIHVRENTKSYKRKSGGTIWMGFRLDPESCNVYFFSDSKMSMIQMVSRGTVTRDVYYSGCSYMELEQPCAIYFTYIKSTCKGQFEFRDQNDNKALVVTLDVEPEELNLSPVGITLGVLSILSGCCGCLKYCCCGSSSSQKEEEEEEEEEGEGSPENEPAVRHNENDSETVRIKLEDSAPDGYGFAQPSSNETGPLMQTPPPGAIKYPQASGSDQGAIHGPSSIISEPCFTVKGLNFPSVLSSESSSHEVYTSDKLNFS